LSARRTMRPGRYPLLLGREELGRSLPVRRMLPHYEVAYGRTVNRACTFPYTSLTTTPILAFTAPSGFNPNRGSRDD
jgi:hypothetical protein